MTSPDTPAFRGNNELALALTMIIPLMYSTSPTPMRLLRSTSARSAAAS